MINQEQTSQYLVGPTYQNPDTKRTYREKGPLDDQRDRVNQTTRANDLAKNARIGIRDMDDAFLFYFREVIRPTVMVDGKVSEVPIVYGNPEKWKAVQKEGFYRDKNGKRQIPVIIFKRDSLHKVRNMANKLDANRPHNTYVTAKHYSYRNTFDNFDKAKNRVPEYEFISTVVPDFVKLEYSVIVLTDYIEQMNPIIEAINFASDSYWGRQEAFKFQSFVGDIRTEIMTNQSEDRTVKSDFKVTLNGYIVPQTVNSNPYVNYKKRNLTTLNVSFQEQTITGQRELEKVLSL